MYTEHFGLAKELFEDGLAQDSDVFLGDRQRLLAANLTIALTRRDSIAVLSGRPGVGKTTIAAQSLRNMATRLALGWLGSVPASPHELLEQLLTEFGFSPYRNSRAERLQIWRQFLNEMSITDTRVCVLVENAQDFDVEVLRALESLTARDPNGCPGANLVLTSSSRLRELLETPALAALKQRTRMQGVVEPFTAAETRVYLEHKVAAAGGETVFGDRAIEMLHRYSEGIARVLNNLCESALTVAAARHESQLGAQVVKRVAEGLFGMTASVGAAAAPAPSPAPVVPAPVVPAPTAPTEPEPAEVDVPTLGPDDAIDGTLDISAPDHDGSAGDLVDAIEMTEAEINEAEMSEAEIDDALSRGDALNLSEHAPDFDDEALTPDDEIESLDDEASLDEDAPTFDDDAFGLGQDAFDDGLLILEDDDDAASAEPASAEPAVAADTMPKPDTKTSGQAHDVASQSMCIPSLFASESLDVPTLTDCVDPTEDDAVETMQDDAPDAPDSAFAEIDLAAFDEDADDDSERGRLGALEAFANAKVLEDISNSMAETLFGDAELDQLAATLAVTTEKQKESTDESDEDAVRDSMPRAHFGG